MAANEALLVLKIISDTKDAAKGLDDASESTSKFQSNLNKAAAGATVAAGAVVAFGVSAAQAAAEDAQGQALLAQALRNSTGARDSDIASVEDWISSTAAATGVADDQLRPALATLARATGDVAKSQDLMSLALDVSAATGKDVESVSTALSKAYGGQTGAIKKLVPGIDDAVLATGDMNAITAELARLMGGSAAAAADTAAGKMQRTQLAMDETKESIGAALLPAFEALADVMLTVATWAQNNSTVFLILMGVVLAVAAALIVLSTVTKIVAAVTAIQTAAQWALNSAFLASPITWIVLAVVALIAVIVLIATKTTWFQDIWDAAWGAIKAAAMAVWNWIASNWPLLLAILTGPIGLAVLFIVNHLDDITGAAKAVWSYLSGAFSTIWDTIKNTATTALEAIRVPINAISDAFSAVVGWIQRVIEWIGRIKIPDAVTNFIGKVVDVLPLGASASTAGSASTVPRVGGRAMVGGLAANGTSGGGGGGPTIIIQGAIDPVATAQQIRRILRDDQRRRTGVMIGPA